MKDSAVYERAVLWSVLLDGTLWTDVAQALDVDDFTDATHRRMWESFITLSRAGRTITEESLAHEIEAAGDIAKVDQASLVVGSPYPDTGSLEGYVDEVKQARRRRDAREVFANALALPPGELTEEHLHAAIVRLTEIAHDASSAAAFVAIGDALPGYMERIAQDRLTKADRGIPYGLPPLDRQTDGMMPGDLIIVAARPGDGKTALALTIADAVSTRGLTVPVFSLEMPKEQLLGRLVSARASVNGRDFRNPRNLDEEALDAAKRAARGLLNNRILIWDRRASVRDIEAACRRLVRRGERLGCVVIDYLDLVVTAKEERRKDRHDLEIGAKTSALKQLGKELGCPIVLLVQIGRDVEKSNRRPTKADLKNSGAIEQDADTVLLLYRKRVDDGTGAMVATDETEIIIDKMRGGETGVVRVRFRAEYTRFEDSVEQSMPGLQPPPRSFTDPDSGWGES